MDIENKDQTSKSNNNIKYIIIIGILSFLLLALLISNIIFIVKYKNAQKNNEAESIYKPREEQYIEILDNMDVEDDEGAKEYQGKFDILNSKYYKSLDIYNMKSSGSLILLEKFKTYQQTTSYTCGCASLIMAINYIDNKV